MKDWRGWFDPALYVLTALADGADQLVADEASKLGIKIIAVAPMPVERYRETINDRDEFNRHWENAALRLVLPDVPGDEDNFNVRQYEQLGVLLGRRSHLLLAIWDGEGPSGDGGTGAVARMRLMGDHGAATFRGSPMFADANSLLDMAWRGPCCGSPFSADALQWKRTAKSPEPVFYRDCRIYHGTTDPSFG